MRSLQITCCVVALMWPLAVSAQPALDPAHDRLTLDAAIRLAVDNNRTLAASRLQVQKAEEDLAASRTRRLPAIDLTVTASELLTPVSFSFPRGAFGEIPGVGPFPTAATDVTTDRRPNLFVSSQATQPLTQLIRINLGIHGNAAALEIERTRLRDQELAVINSVKRAYFAILQSESAVAASDEAIALYRELDRSLDVRVAQKVALRSEALDVKVQLAQEQLTRTTWSNTLASQKEQLNALLGRDVATAFDAAPASALTLAEVDLETARARALDARPDVREARLKVRQADLDRRMKRSERIPDVGIAASYVSNFNLDVLPRNLASIGVQLKWEPFDWGRKGRELAAKQHILDQTRLAVRETEDRAIVDINARFRKLAESRARLNVAEMARDASREKLRVKSNQFQMQAVLLADVLHVRAELASTTDQYQQALAAFWTAKADFDRAVGEEGIQ